MSLGPFDLTGEPFLTMYGALFLAAIAAGFIIPRRMRPQGRYRTVTDVDELAYLAGGAARFGDAVVARLLSARALVMTGRDLFSVSAREQAVTHAERSVVALPAPIRWREIERTLKPQSDPIMHKLADAGLLMTDAEHGNIRFWAVLPYLMLFVFGATKWIIGDMREKPVGFLTLLLLATAIFAILRFFSLDRRTEAGLDALADAEDRSARLKAAPTTSEIGLAVALFGTAVLVGSGWSDFHKLRNSSDGGSTGGGDSSGDGGCGGGCGGCGG